MTSEGYCYRINPCGHGPDQGPWQWEVYDRGSGEQVSTGIADTHIEAIDTAQTEVASMVDRGVEAAATSRGPRA